jgi:hypothetical protein
VIADDPRLVRGALEQVDHLTPLVRVLDGPDHRRVLLGRDREQLLHPGEPPRQLELQGLSLVGAQGAQDRVPNPIVAEPHGRLRPGIHHQQALLERGSQGLVGRGRR